MIFTFLFFGGEARRTADGADLRPRPWEQRALGAPLENMLAMMKGLQYGHGRSKIVLRG